MNAASMLSANKVKLHGMTSNRWTTKDKIIQYKGLIKLYTRDRKIMEIDSGVAAKKQTHELKKLRKQIGDDRQALDNAICGDKQKLRNTLAAHREMQLAYQYAQPQKVIEMVEQVNFNKRKARDLLQYKKHLKKQELIQRKLRYGELEDSIKFEHLSWQSQLPNERLAHIITGKVQDAILKKEAAIVVRDTYKQMIAVMKKDALYFDAILEAIKRDGLNQGKCMINATKLGQLATEYLDDRRQEFEMLEKVIKRDLGNRRKDLAMVKQRVESFGHNVKNLVRRDSDINLGTFHLESSESYTNLRKDVETIESTLRLIKDAIFVPNLESIYPCLQEQVRQKNRLSAMVEKCESTKAELLKRVKHGEVIESELKNATINNTHEYKRKKRHFFKEVENQSTKNVDLAKLIHNRRQLAAKVRISLKHLQLLASLLSDDARPHSTARKLYAEFGRPQAPPADEIDGTRIVRELIERFTKLSRAAKVTLIDDDRYHAYKLFEQMMRESTRSKKDDKVLSESLIDPIFLDPHVFTRDDIKKRSEEIVMANRVEDEFADYRKK
ncbi:uncharacterized protein LOC132707068 [Cylas formicarius]|uniref:uncharacterized protein LOC132707068 n=1 Tax=Cylas formicarius TaxID=197179 RepID=UPI002958BF35|nr:uncharacterized protein LOC132707068 [Cylas formicarius]